MSYLRQSKRVVCYGSLCIALILLVSLSPGPSYGTYETPSHLAPPSRIKPEAAGSALWIFIPALSVSQGIRTGRIVYNSPHRPANQSTIPSENAVLVSERIFPEDEPLIQDSQGIVVTGGSPLAHAGIIARELAIPSVVVKGKWKMEGGQPYLEVPYEDASKTARLREGDVVVVDGDRGQLLLLSLNPVERAKIAQIYEDVVAYKRFPSDLSFERLFRHIDASTTYRAGTYFLNEFLVWDPRVPSDERKEIFQMFMARVGEPLREEIVEKLRIRYEEEKLGLHALIRHIAQQMTRNVQEPLQALHLMQGLERKMTELRDLEFSMDREPSSFARELEPLKQIFEARWTEFKNQLEEDVYDASGEEQVSASRVQALCKRIKLLGHESSSTASMDKLDRDLGVKAIEAVGDKAILPFFQGDNQVSHHVRDRVGGKAVGLGNLFDVVPVPPGFVVTTGCLHEFLKRNSITMDGRTNTLGAWIEGTAKKGLSPADEAEQIQKLFDQSTMNVIPELRDEILAYYRRMPDPMVAVRSSAVAEATAWASFAGQMDTFLNVMGEEELLRNIINVWRSFWSERAIHYRKAKKVPLQIEHAVVVQQMVRNPRVSGVMSTLDPSNNDPTRILISAGYGLGEGPVAGRTDADLLVIDRRDFGRITENIADKKEQYIPKTGGGIVLTPVLPRLRKEPALTPAEVKRLSAMAVEIERTVGAPVDIEYAIDENGIHIVQVRPITTFYRGEKHSLAELHPNRILERFVSRSPQEKWEERSRQVRDQLKTLMKAGLEDTGIPEPVRQRLAGEIEKLSTQYLNRFYPRRGPPAIHWVMPGQTVTEEMLQQIQDRHVFFHCGTFEDGQNFFYDAARKISGSPTEIYQRLKQIHGVFSFAAEGRPFLGDRYGAAPHMNREFEHAALGKFGDAGFRFSDLLFFHKENVRGHLYTFEHVQSSDAKDLALLNNSNPEIAPELHVHLDQMKTWISNNPRSIVARDTKGRIVGVIFVSFLRLGDLPDSYQKIVGAHGESSLSDTMVDFWVVASPRTPGLGRLLPNILENLSSWMGSGIKYSVANGRPMFLERSLIEDEYEGHRRRFQAEFGAQKNQWYPAMMSWMRKSVLQAKDGTSGRTKQKFKRLAEKFGGRLPLKNGYWMYRKIQNRHRLKERRREAFRTLVADDLESMRRKVGPEAIRSVLQEEIRKSAQTSAGKLKMQLNRLARQLDGKKQVATVYLKYRELMNPHYLIPPIPKIFESLFYEGLDIDRYIQERYLLLTRPNPLAIKDPKTDEVISYEEYLALLRDHPELFKRYPALDGSPESYAVFTVARGVEPYLRYKERYEREFHGKKLTQADFCMLTGRKAEDAVLIGVHQRNGGEVDPEPVLGRPEDLSSLGRIMRVWFRGGPEDLKKAREAAKGVSYVEGEPRLRISEGLERVIGSAENVIQKIMRRTGLTRDELIDLLSHYAVEWYWPDNSQTTGRQMLMLKAWSEPLFPEHWNIDIFSMGPGEPIVLPARARKIGEREVIRRMMNDDAPRVDLQCVGMYRLFEPMRGFSTLEQREKAKRELTQLFKTGQGGVVYVSGRRPSALKAVALDLHGLLFRSNELFGKLYGLLYKVMMREVPEPKSINDVDFTTLDVSEGRRMFDQIRGMLAYDKIALIRDRAIERHVSVKSVDDYVRMHFRWHQEMWDRLLGPDPKGWFTPGAEAFLKRIAVDLPAAKRHLVSAYFHPAVRENVERAVPKGYFVSVHGSHMTAEEHRERLEAGDVITSKRDILRNILESEHARETEIAFWGDGTVDMSCGAASGVIAIGTANTLDNGLKLIDAGADIVTTDLRPLDEIMAMMTANQPATHRAEEMKKDAAHALPVTEIHLAHIRLKAQDLYTDWVLKHPDAHLVKCTKGRGLSERFAGWDQNTDTLMFNVAHLKGPDGRMADVLAVSEVGGITRGILQTWVVLDDSGGPIELEHRKYSTLPAQFMADDMYERLARFHYSFVELPPGPPRNLNQWTFDFAGHEWIDIPARASYAQRQDPVGPQAGTVGSSP